MKPFTNKLPDIAIFMFFPLLYFWKKARKTVIAALLLFTVLCTSCFQHYFRTGTQASVDAATIQTLMSVNKMFIIHFKNRVGELKNLTISNDKLEADMISVAPEHLKYVNPDPSKTNFVKKTDKANALMEVHLYYPQEATSDLTHLSIPLSGFNRVDVYEFDKKTTTANHILTWIGIGVVSIAAASFITLMIACNCPQVCVNNNGEYQFVSGVYSGAVYSSLERTDYLPLPLLNTSNKTLRIKINNVRDEEQFINRVQLLEVSHPAGSNVLSDRHGNVFSYNKPFVPFSATVNKTIDIKKQIAIADEDQYLFDSEKSEAGLSSIILTFNKPADAKKAKLVVHAGNSTWSGYLYHSFAGLFGNGYEKWKAEKDRSDPKEMEKWQTDQGLPLMVYVEKNNKWEFADYFAHTGNTASRDLIMELDIASLKPDRVKIKLETVYQFWNLDFAGIDFSENNHITSTLLDPSNALKPDGSDQISFLNAVDKNYTHLNSEEEISLEYQLSSVKEDKRNTYFLVSTGYYHNMKKYEGSPKLATLLKFKNKYAFDNYSREMFSEVKKNLSSYTIQNNK